MFNDEYAANVKRRRDLSIDGYKTLTEVGFDGHWITPYQKISCSAEGPVLVARSWFDVENIEKNRNALLRLGYLPELPFNQVLEHALNIANLRREDIYLTQVLLVIPLNAEQKISQISYDESFKKVTRYELKNRKVVAIGHVAQNLCEKYEITHTAVISPSAPGISYQAKAQEIASALL